MTTSRTDANRPLFLGIDDSTQSTTAVLICAETARLVAEISVNFDEHFKGPYNIDKGVTKNGDEVTSDPLMWLEALDLVLASLRKEVEGHGLHLGMVRALAVSGQQHGTVYLNGSAADSLRDLSPGRSLKDNLSGIFSRKQAPVWMDSSTGAQCKQIEARLGGRLLAITGNGAFARFSGPQIAKFAQVQPAAYRQTSHIALVSSFITSVLAGQLVPIDPGDGSGTALMDISSRQWSPDALGATANDLQSKLLPIAPASRVVGEISSYFVEKYGFDGGCRVMPGSGDNPSSLIGLGLVDAGQTAVSLGTSDTLFACVDKPNPCTTGEGCLFCSPDDRHYMALICFKNGSLAREAIRDQYHLNWSEFDALLGATRPGNQGGILLSYPDPEIVPHVTAPFSLYHRLSPSEVGRCVRAIVESRALSARVHSEWMGAKVRSLRITGGASVSPAIRQVFADVFGSPVESIQTTNSAALGAALRAWHGFQQCTGEPMSWGEIVAPFTKPTGSSQPNTEATAVYDQMLPIFRRVEGAHAAGGDLSSADTTS